MTAKEYLRQLVDIDQRIRDYHDEALKIRTEMEKMTPSLTGMPMGSPQPDKIGEKLDGVVRWEQLLNDSVDEACRLKVNAMLMIEQLKDKRLRDLLFKRYIAGKEFTLIAVEMGYDYYHTCHLHGRALHEFDRVLKEHKQTQL